MSLVFLAPSNSSFIFSLKLSIFKAYVIRLLLCKSLQWILFAMISLPWFLRFIMSGPCQLSVSFLRVSAKPFCNLHLRSSSHLFLLKTPPVFRNQLSQKLISLQSLLSQPPSPPLSPQGGLDVPSSLPPHLYSTSQPQHLLQGGDIYVG